MNFNKKSLTKTSFTTCLQLSRPIHTSVMYILLTPCQGLYKDIYPCNIDLPSTMYPIESLYKNSWTKSAYVPKHRTQHQ